MATTVIKPDFLDVPGWRQVVKNNAPILWIDFEVESSETWLPSILSQAGFFVSNGDVKRNQPKLWRDAVDGEIIDLSWAAIRIHLIGDSDRE